MILTQRQLEQIFKQNGQIVIPYRARLTPSAQDWIRHNKIKIGYDEVKLDLQQKPAPPGWAHLNKQYLWWSDGPDGVSKAAIGMSAREVMLKPMPILEDGSRAISAVRTLSHAIAGSAASGGVIVAKNPAIACLIANKCTNLRAVIATSLAGVEEAVHTIAANVLIVEREKWPLSPLKNLLVRFCKLDRKMDRVLEDELKTLLTPSTYSQQKPCCEGCAK